ncbi:histone-lysine N-methyltransferase ASH1L-like isoform X1 [Labeo rohita]|uniref:Histone-lysine N-methyltransferase ASH1L-like isoform X1 n=1 Tax=Labeo rohita TaxID=84645 RepID=A0A498N946_LABRO|nr:histone-lysine N-methyltransferase ASH1L-like isoform X1 [Labeo rohita]
MEVEREQSESFQPGGSLFSEHFSASPSLNEGQERERREKRPNISRTHFQTNDIRPFSSCTATKISLSNLNNSKNTAQSKRKLKHVKKPLKKKNPRGQEVTGSEVKRRGRGRPRKNPAPCFSPPLPATPLHFEATECPAKRKKGERDDYTVLSAIESMAQHEKRKRRKKRDEMRSDDRQLDEGKDATLSQEPSQSHIDTSSPSKDPSVSVNSQAEKSPDMAAEKIYEWAGLYSNVYKSENPTSLSSPVHTDCLDYDPEEHEHGLLPAPIHVGKYLRLKRIDFQLPYDIYRLCAQEKTEDSSCKHQKLSVNHDCVSDSLNGNVSPRPNTEETGKEISETDIENNLPNQPDPPKQQTEDSSCKHQKLSVNHDCVSDSLNGNVSPRPNTEETGKEISETDIENNLPNQPDPPKQQELRLGTWHFSDQCLTHSSPQSENREGDDEGRSVQSKNLTQTLQGIYDVIVSHKGSSGQTLAAPLLNLCSRKRSGSAPVDLSTLQKQLLAGHYESLDSFHSDMLKVFHCAEVKTALLEMPFVSMDTADA